MVLSIPLFLNNLDAKEYGTWLLVTSITSGLVFFTFGSGDVSTRYIAYCRNRKKNIEESGRIFSNIISIQFCINLTVLFFLYFSLEYIVPIFDIDSEN